MSEERTFVARVQAILRVAIPKVVAENLDIDRGDVVEVKVKKVGSKR